MASVSSLLAVPEGITIVSIVFLYLPTYRLSLSSV